MTLSQLVVYGVIQGVAEFLPISSSAHLALLPHFLHIDDPGVAFDLMMHIGTALAVVIYFKKELFSYTKVVSEIVTFKKVGSREAQFAKHLMIATITTFTLAVLIKDLGETVGRKPIFIIINLVIFGLYMWWGDRKPDQDTKLLDSKLDWKKALSIGFAQGIAIFPGVSRSGATMGTARWLGIGREEASRFSFLMSLPVIAAGAVVKLPEVLSGNAQFALIDCFLGIVFSFIFGFVTIFFFMKLIKKIGLGYFTIYRILLALALSYYFY